MTRGSFDSHARRSGTKYLSCVSRPTGSTAELAPSSPSISFSMSAAVSMPSPSGGAPTAADVDLPTEHAAAVGGSATCRARSPPRPPSLPAATHWSGSTPLLRPTAPRARPVPDRRVGSGTHPCEGSTAVAGSGLGGSAAGSSGGGNMFVRPVVLQLMFPQFFSSSFPSSSAPLRGFEHGARIRQPQGPRAGRRRMCRPMTSAQILRVLLRRLPQDLGQRSRDEDVHSPLLERLWRRARHRSRSDRSTSICARHLSTGASPKATRRRRACQRGSVS